MDVVGRFYRGMANGREEIASTSAGLYSEESVHQTRLMMRECAIPVTP